MKAREIMTPEPDVVTSAEPLSRAASIMRERDVGSVPVVSDRETMHLQGIITDRDIAIRHVADRHQSDCRVGDHMTSDGIATVRPDSDLSQVLEMMKRQQVRRVPVTDDQGRLMGIIAQADIAIEQADQAPDKVADVVEKISEPARPKH